MPFAKRVFSSIEILSVALGVLFISIWLLADRPQKNPSNVVQMGAELSSKTNAATDRFITGARELVRRNPRSPVGYTRLASGLLQQARETGDPGLYSKAETLLGEALRLDPKHVDAMTEMGSLLLSRHDFQAALEWGKRALAVDPFSIAAHALTGDAYTELGEYEAAVQTVQTMVDLRPDSRSYARVSYLRELHGDFEGAIAAMKTAAKAAAPQSEQSHWYAVQLGHLYFNSGKMREGEKIFLEAIGDPPYAFATAGLASIRVAQKRYGEAIVLYEQALELLPEHAFAEALADAYRSAGMPAEAARYNSLVREMLANDAKNKMDTDLELALFNADHDQEIGEALRCAQREYGRRPKSIKTADALAWTLAKAGRFEEAYPYVRQAIHLGTNDATMLFHAGSIAYHCGRRDEAREYLTKALAVNPYFSNRYSAEAQDLLRGIKGENPFPTVASVQ